MSSRLDSGAAWITYYFLANLGLTIHNKWVLKELHFDFPWLLTAIHIGVSGVGAAIMIYIRRVCKPARLSRQEKINLLLFRYFTLRPSYSLILISFLYTVNIAISNVSLNFVTLAFHQIVRSSTPFFTVILEMIMLYKFHSNILYVSLIPVVGGVVISALADYGNSVEFSALGVFLTVFGVVLSALKGIVTNIMMNGKDKISLHPLDLLCKLAPLAFAQCLVYAWSFGEISDLYTFLFYTPKSADQVAPQTSKDRWALCAKLFFNGLLAFWLNWVSFTANKKTSALTMTVAGNVKQAISILLAIYIFRTAVSELNVFGIIVTVSGGAWYSYCSYMEKIRAKGPVVHLRSDEILPTTSLLKEQLK